MPKPILSYSITLWVFFTLLPIIHFSQNQTNNWYFGGNAGLNFSDGRVSILNNSSMNTPAGSSVISDKNGQLLFYSNGKTIWNRNHDVMENGDNLAGEISNNQSVLIVGHPKNTQTFYIFTTRINPTFDGGFQASLYYSQVLIDAVNPLGKVVRKNLLLRNNISERLAATYNSDDDTISVVVFGKALNNEDAPYENFYTYRIAQSGFTGPVGVSNQKPTVDSNGSLKISPNNKYIAIADYEGGAIHIYDFEINTSSISHKESFEVFIPFAKIPPYSLEFSPDSNTLYFNGENVLFKYSIEPTEDFERRKTVAFTNNFKIGSLQLARNGKIYCASYLDEDGLDQLSVINNPNNFDGNSEFEELKIDLGTGTSKMGLPIFLSSELRNRIITKNRCADEVFLFEIDTYAEIGSVIWDFGDGTRSTQLSPSHKYDRSGKYMLKATITIGECEIDLFKEIQAYAVPDPLDEQSLKQCIAENTEPVIFNLNEIQEKLALSDKDYDLIFFKSQNDAANTRNPIETPESYQNDGLREKLFVKIISPNGCSDITSFFLETVSVKLEDIRPMFSCESTDGVHGNNEGLFPLRDKLEDIKDQVGLDDSIKAHFYLSREDALIEREPIPFNFVSGPRIIWVRIEDGQNDCSGLEPIELKVSEPIILDIEERYTLCYDPIKSFITFDGGIGNDKWEWYDENDRIISNQRLFTATEIGQYSVTAYIDENGIQCSRTEHFRIIEPREPSIESIQTDNGTITIQLNAFGDYQFSIDGRNFFGSGVSHTFENVKGGIYTVDVRDRDQCEKPLQERIAIISFPRFFTPNNDGFNDRWKIYGISRQFYSSATIKIYDRYGKVFKSLDLKNNEMGWDGKFNGQQLPSNDYWFQAQLIDLGGNSIVTTGHFTLKN